MEAGRADDDPPNQPDAPKPASLLLKFHMKSSNKAANHRNNSERSQNRPQNRHLRPWKKGDPNIPKSPGRPRSVWHEFGRYVMEHPDSLDDYFGHPGFGKKRIHRLLDVMIERHTVQLFYCIYGRPR
jgi:hypothetical protein